MTVLSTSLNTTFTPTKTVFRLQINGEAKLYSRNSAAVATWDPVMTGAELRKPATLTGIVTVDNDVIGAQYKVIAVTENTTFSADE